MIPSEVVLIYPFRPIHMLCCTYSPCGARDVTRDVPQFISRAAGAAHVLGPDFITVTKNSGCFRAGPLALTSLYDPTAANLVE